MIVSLKAIRNCTIKCSTVLTSRYEVSRRYDAPAVPLPDFWGLRLTRSARLNASLTHKKCAFIVAIRRCRPACPALLSCRLHCLAPKEAILSGILTHCEPLAARACIFQFCVRPLRAVHVHFLLFIIQTSVESCPSNVDEYAGVHLAMRSNSWVVHRSPSAGVTLTLQLSTSIILKLQGLLRFP